MRTGTDLHRRRFLVDLEAFHPELLKVLLHREHLRDEEPVLLYFSGEYHLGPDGCPCSYKVPGGACAVGPECVLMGHRNPGLDRALLAVLETNCFDDDSRRAFRSEERRVGKE